VELDKRILPVFDFVESWPCVRPQVWRAAHLEGTDARIEPILKEKVVGCRALRVHGNCQKADGLLYECCRNLDRRVLKGPWTKDQNEPDPPELLMSRRPITGVCQDREVDRPESTVRDLLCDIRLLREQCSNTDASCSVYLSRMALDANEIHAHRRGTDNSAVKPVKRAAGLSLDFLDDEAPQPIILRVAEDITETCQIKPLAAVRRTPGSGSIALQLEKVRDALLYSLNNTHVAPDFLDLAPYLGLFEEVEEQFTAEEKDPTDGDVGEAKKAGLHAGARDLAEYLGQAVRERNRDDVSGLTHHRHSAPFSASGFSRLAAVGGFAVAKTLSRFDRGRNIRSFLVERLCVLSKDADYLELGRVPILSAPIRSALEPYFYFGLGLTAGHIFWRAPSNRWATKQKLPNLAPPMGPKMSDQQHMTNYLADSFCLNMVFCGDIERHVHAWVAHLLEVLEREYMRVIYDSGGTVNRESLKDHFRGVAGRLIIAAMVGHLQKDFPPEDASASATKVVRQCIDDAIGDCADKPCGIVARMLREFVEDLGGKPSVLESLIAIAKIVVADNRDPKVHVDIASEPKECVRAWNSGKIVDEVIDHPLAALACLLPGAPASTAGAARAQDPAASELARNVAAILSVGMWREMTTSD
jgi:hypothetical protein